MNRFLISIFFLVLIACDKDVSNSELPQPENAILGSWQQISYQYSLGGPLLSEDVKDGMIIRFREDLTFSITYVVSDALITGVYSMKNDTLTRTYNYDTDRINYDSKTLISDNVLTLIPISPQICIEGCSTKYRKID